jgi:hypothetical protein
MRMLIEDREVELPTEVCVCAVCGKMSEDWYGNKKIHRLWDESCSLNAVKCRTDHLEFNETGRVVDVKKGGEMSHLSHS